MVSAGLLDSISKMRAGCLFKQLHPTSGAHVVLGVDPDVRNHQLEGEQGTGRDKSDDREAVDETVAGCFLIIVIDRDSGCL